MTSSSRRGIERSFMSQHHKRYVSLSLSLSFRSFIVPALITVVDVANSLCLCFVLSFTFIFYTLYAYVNY